MRDFQRGAKRVVLQLKTKIIRCIIVCVINLIIYKFRRLRGYKISSLCMLTKKQIGLVHFCEQVGLGFQT